MKRERIIPNPWITYKVHFQFFEVFSILSAPYDLKNTVYSLEKNFLWNGLFRKKLSKHRMGANLQTFLFDFSNYHSAWITD